MKDEVYVAVPQSLYRYLSMVVNPALLEEHDIRYVFSEDLSLITNVKANEDNA